MRHENEICGPWSDCPAYSPVQEVKAVISSVFPVYWGTKTGVNMKLKSPHYPGHARGGGGERGFQMADALSHRN